MNNHTIYNVLEIKAITMMKIDKMGTIYLAWGHTVRIFACEH